MDHSRILWPDGVGAKAWKQPCARAGNPDFYQEADGDWTFEDINRHAYWHEDNNGADEEHVDQSQLTQHSYVTLLGFHPFKETVFLNSSLSRGRGFAYDLNSSKVQDLGNMCPTYYHQIAGQHAYIKSAFPYTPCWMNIPKRKRKKTRSSGAVLNRRPLQAHHKTM